VRRLPRPGRLSVARAVADPDRLAALDAIALLDTPAEGAFDRLTRLASRLLRAPVALVSLVAGDRQFFKSCIGLAEPWASARETPLSHSFCQHAVERREPLLIRDARDHPLVRDNPAIQDLGVIAYAGIPLAMADGHVLGSFCVIDHEPRRWTVDEVATLRDLAAAAVTELELRAALRLAEAARAEAAAANRAKDDFLARVSHELRTPLSGIASNAQMMAMGLCGPVTEQQERALGRIRLCQDHLLSLITQLLDFKKIAAGRVDYALVALPAGEALRTAAVIVESQLREAGIAFERPEPDPAITLRADPDKLRQVLVNLLSNAAQFTPAGGTVALSCDAAGGRARIHVRDTGIGIPPDQLDAVFEPFVRLRSEGRGTPGTGLGLAISRDLARGMGGELCVASEVGRGSTFTLTMPLA